MKKLQMPTDEEIADQIENFRTLARMENDPEYDACADRLQRREDCALIALAESLAAARRKTKPARQVKTR